MKSQEITIPDNLPVHADKRTQVKTITLPFTFPDGVAGAIVVLHLDKWGWKPSEEIKKITIEFHDHTTD